MSSDKMSRKEIREPDPFVRVTTEYWNKVMAHRKLVYVGVAAFVVVFLVAGIVSNLSARKDREAGNALASALAIESRPVEGAAVPGDEAAGPAFKTAKEKDEAVAKELDAVRKAHAGTPSAATATLVWADKQYRLGALDEAMKGYEEYIKNAPANDVSRALALEGKGYVHEAKKEYEKALEAFDQMGREASGASMKAQAAYHRARVLEVMGKKQEAAAAFQKVQEDFKDERAASDAGDRLALLAGQGVALPEAKPAEPAPAQPK